jgi:hypothetical protein
MEAIPAITKARVQDRFLSERNKLEHLGANSVRGNAAVELHLFFGHKA